jgi:hypothetical protein
VEQINSLQLQLDGSALRTTGLESEITDKDVKISEISKAHEGLPGTFFSQGIRRNDTTDTDLQAVMKTLKSKNTEISKKNTMIESLSSLSSSSSSSSVLSSSSSLISNSSQSSFSPMSSQPLNSIISSMDIEDNNRSKHSSFLSSADLVKACSMGLSEMTKYMKGRDGTMSTEKLLSYEHQKYVTELSKAGALPFLDLFVTIVDNADAISRNERHASIRNEIERIAALTTLEVSVMAHICEYLIGSDYSWEFAFLYCLVELAGHRSSESQRKLGKVLPGAPSPGLMAHYMKEAQTSRKLELLQNPVPIRGDIIAQHDNAAGMGYIARSSRQKAYSSKKRVAALAIILVTKDSKKPHQFLQEETKYAPHAVFSDLKQCPRDILNHTPEESEFLKEYFLNLINVELQIMKDGNYQIGDGLAKNNEKPSIKIPSEKDELKQKVCRICPGCQESYDFEYSRRTCTKMLAGPEENSTPYMCGHDLPSKETAILAYVLNPDNEVSDEDNIFRTKYYAII